MAKWFFGKEEEEEESRRFFPIARRMLFTRRKEEKEREKAFWGEKCGTGVDEWKLFLLLPLSSCSGSKEHFRLGLGG